MSLKENLLNLTKSSKNDKKELSVSELAKLREVLVEAMQKDAKNGLYVTKYKVNKVNFPNIMYIYLETMEFFYPGSGMDALKKDLERSLDTNLMINTENDGNLINISTYWGS